MTDVLERPSAPSPAEPPASDHKPLMTQRQILLMNAGFFGIQYSFGLQQTAINPIFTFIGANPHDLPLLNLAGPITGLLIQPMIGALSDRTWSDRWGRRKPYFLIGAIGCAVCLFLFPFVSALWMAVLLLWLLDASNNTAMEPYRAFIADKLPESQLAKGFLTQSFFTGAGITLANFSLFIFQQILDQTTAAGIPYWVFGSFMLGAVCSIGTVLVSVLRTPEIPPSEAELEELRSRPSGLGPAVTEIAHAVRDMPASLHKLGLVYLFQWYAIVIYWQFASLSIAESVWGVDTRAEGFEETAGYDAAGGWIGVLNGTYNIVTMLSAFFLVGLARKYGAKWVHAACLVLAALGMWVLAGSTNQYAALIPMIGLGIAWASMMGVPYIMAISMVPKERYGVYMGILNMMIVVPMMIQSVTFGWVYENLLGDDPNNAILLSGALFLAGAIAMTWIRPPKRQSPVIPLTYRHIMGYDKVLVGSDGSPSSMAAVRRAAEVASAAEAELVVAVAYNPLSGRDEARLSMATPPAEPGRQVVRGSDDARKAVDTSIGYVNTDRLKSYSHVLVEGDPAQAIVAVAQDQRADLIVVGNRGLGATIGSVLGSVPAAVAGQAPCDVLIVQTGAVPGNHGYSTYAGATTGHRGQMAPAPEDADPRVQDGGRGGSHRLGDGDR